MISFNVDIAIIAAFLAINLIVGLYSGRGITTIREYAIGNRNFSTATIAATIIATWIFGSSVSMNLFETYNDGLYFFIPAIADGISFFVVAYFFAPRMGEFLGNLSVAEAMGNLYGNYVRLVTSASGIIPAIGSIAMQFSILAVLLDYLFGTTDIYNFIFSGLIVIVYSSFGGIKSVTFTDMIQFFAFGVVIPMMAFLIWNELDNTENVLNILASHQLFSYEEVLNVNNPRFSNTILLFLFFLIPGFNPALFQRIAIARNTTQVSRSFIIAGIIITCCYVILDFTGLLLLADNVTNINQDNVLCYILDNYFHAGFKGLVIIGVMGMLMSTADSYINSASILIAYDCPKSMGIELTTKQELLIARIASVLIGIAGLVLSLFLQNLLDIMLATFSFYMPIVSVPLILAIFGFRSTNKAVLIGMTSGFITVILFQFFSKIDSTMPGMLANIVFFIGSHYILGEKGGWVGIKDQAPLDAIRLQRKRKIFSFIQSIKTFNLIKFCENNTPKEEKIFVYFGLFCMVAIFSNAYTLPKNIQEQYSFILNSIYYSVLTISTIFITYPIWLEKFKNQAVTSVLWNIAVFYNLAFIGSLLVVIGRFEQIQITILMASLVAVATLMRWQVAMLLIIGGAITSIQCYKIYIDTNFLPSEMDSLQFKITYSLLLVISILIAFLKPKQELQKLTKEKIEHLGVRISDREEELQKSLELKYEFLRNLEHEVHTPITGITSLGQVLNDNYDKLTEKQRRNAIEDIAKSSQRLNSLTNNLLDLSKLSSLTYELHKEDVDLSELVHDRLEQCKKLYLGSKELEFITDITPDIIVNCDRHYITSTIDNLIINATQYSKATGEIIITLSKTTENIEFSIQDEGIGIPPSELYDVFGAFTVSSKTRSSAGGRGVGLALCKKSVEVHGGEIKAESDGKKGARFSFTLPRVS